MINNNITIIITNSYSPAAVIWINTCIRKLHVTNRPSLNIAGCKQVGLDS